MNNEETETHIKTTYYIIGFFLLLIASIIYLTCKQRKKERLSINRNINLGNLKAKRDFPTNRVALKQMKEKQ